MLKTIAAAMAVLTITGSAAWAGAGADFCKAMQDQHIACGSEVRNKDAAGAYLGRCPAAIDQLNGAYDQARSSARSSELAVEIENAHKLWLDIATNIIPEPSETESEYTRRSGEDVSHIIAECKKLRALD